MKILLYYALVSILVVGCVSMPPCRAKEDINPVDQSPSLLIGENKGMELNIKFIVDEKIAGKNYIYLEVIGPSAIQTFVEDSAMLTLDNGHEIFLINAKNHKAREEKMNALVVSMDYHYIRYTAPISSKSIRELTASRVKKVFMKLKTFETPAYRTTEIAKKHWVYTKKSTYKKIDRHIEVRLDVLPQINRKAIQYIATCTTNYLK